MDRRFLTVLGVSLVFALVVSSVFYQMTSRGNSGPRKAEPTDMKDVVVATRPLGIGVMVKPADVKLLKVSPDGFPKGAFSKVEEVLDRPVVSNILLDEPLLEGRLAVKGSGMGLAPTIPVGMRAVTVRVNDVSSTAGFVLAGLRVDVLVTGHPPTGDSSNMTTTVLQNVLVLSAGQAMQADTRGSPVSVNTVTLLATPGDAETLTLANGEGRIQLVLRNSSDEGIEKTGGRYVAELYGGAHRPAATAPVRTAAAPVTRPVMVAPPVVIPIAPPAPPPPDQIVMIRGTLKTVEVIPRGN
ncbi:MAG TPA: Flp pilus assembly protein CpaB [Bryobacteraceae bacterium]|jgi:pilus assembly protein CpaB